MGTQPRSPCQGDHGLRHPPVLKGHLCLPVTHASSHSFSQSFGKYVLNARCAWAYSRCQGTGQEQHLLAGPLPSQCGLGGLPGPVPPDTKEQHHRPTGFKPVSTSP